MEEEWMQHDVTLSCFNGGNNYNSALVAGERTQSNQPASFSTVATRRSSGYYS
jgi:hypothetical protein